MTIDDAARLHLFEQARSTWGADAANTLIKAMPTSPDHLATKYDIGSLRGETHAEFAAVRSELSGEIQVLRTEMHGEINALRTEVTGAINTLRAEVAGEINSLRGEMRSEISRGNSELLRTLFFGMVASNATLVGLVLAAVKLG